jgi:CPA2 family monovalent cation:H+ antiporter-2
MNPTLQILAAAAHGAFLHDLATVMLVAGVVTLIFHVLKQPVVLGYIVAGLIVGPYTPYVPLTVHDKDTINLLSELGVILLMFGLGLHFSIRKLAQVGVTAVLGSGIELIGMGLGGYAVGRMFGWPVIDCIFLGAMLAMSSTTIIIKALEGLKLSKEKFADLTFGILIVEDIVGIAIIALLPAVAKTGSLPAAEVLKTLSGLGVFLVSVLVVGLLLVPPLLRYVARFKNNEMLLIVALGLCFGVSLIAMELKYSVALGAFLIGAIIAEARERAKVEALVDPVRDMFSAVFFVSIGMLIDPTMLLKYWLEILIITILVIVGKIVTCSLGTFLAGHDGRTSIRVGMAVSQIGEFSFIIATVGLQLGATSDFLYPIAVTVSGITTLTTPYLIQSSDSVIRIGQKILPTSIANYLAIYSAWLSRKNPERGGMQVRKLLRRLTFQIILNMALVTGLFLAAAATAKMLKSSLPALPAWTGGENALVWLAAMVLSMPMLVVSIRKIRAVAAIVAEASVPAAAAGKNVTNIRNVISSTIRIAGTTAIAIWIILLSSAILPHWSALIVLILLMTLLAVFWWRTFDKLYIKAQTSLKETLAASAAADIDHAHGPPPDADRALPTVLRGALLEMVPIQPNSPAAGKLIRELELRRRTGASAVGIERNGESIVNPGPDEEFQPNDKVLLLGSRPQLDAALALLK